VEGDIKASKRDRSETTLEDNMALSLLFFNRATIATIHDVLQHLLDPCEAWMCGGRRTGWDNAWAGGREKKGKPHWDGRSDEETTAASGGRDRGCDTYQFPSIDKRTKSKGVRE